MKRAKMGSEFLVQIRAVYCVCWLCVNGVYSFVTLLFAVRLGLARTPRFHRKGAARPQRAGNDARKNASTEGLRLVAVFT